MERKSSTKRTLWFGVLIGLVLMLLLTGLAGESKPVVAQAVGPEGQITGCMLNECTNQITCTSSSLDNFRLTTYEAITPCINVGDTGEYLFLAEFDTNATTLYDPVIWIAVDDGEADYGQCYMDWLTPVVDFRGPPLKPFPPVFGDDPTEYEFYNADGDECGDIRKVDNITYAVIGPVEIQCTEDVMTNSFIYASMAYKNNTNGVCPTDFCPDQGSKCDLSLQVPVDISDNDVDMAILKSYVAGVNTFGYDNNGTWVPGDGKFEYDFEVSNEPQKDELGNYLGYLYRSTGYQIIDDLPSYLKVVTEDLPYYCTSEPDSKEWCYSNGGCGGYGDIITCNYR